MPFWAAAVSLTSSYFYPERPRPDGGSVEPGDEATPPGFERLSKQGRGPAIFT